MAIIISNETIAPAVYGGAEGVQPVANSVLDANIQFGKGSIAKVLEKVGTNDPNIYFGNDASTGAGIVVADGKLMSSKVLDVKVIPEVPGVKDASGNITGFAPASLKITYVQDGSVGETTIAISNSNLETRVKALEDFNTIADSDAKINTVKDILDWFDTVSEASTNYKVTVDGSIMDLGKGQAGLLTSVAHNKKDIADIKATIDSLDVQDTSVGNGNVVVKYKQENGKVTISDVSVTETSAVFTEATQDTSANLSVAANTSALLTGESISAIKNYVDAVAAANQEAITINNDSSAYLTVDASNDHLIGVNVTTLGEAVGLTKNNEGKWVTPEGVATVAPGLATAADVAAEIVADEKVIAAALNEHELAINALESKEITVTHSTGNITDLSTGSTVADGSLIVDGSIITSNTYVPALENVVFDGTGATKTYTIKNGDTSVVETIVSVDASVVITQLLNIIQAERVRANNAEAALQHQLNDHENRLKWINLGY